MISMDSTQKLLAQIERFIKRHGMTPQEFGRKAARNDRLVTVMREGGSPRMVTGDKVKSFMQNYSGAAK